MTNLPEGWSENADHDLVHTSGLVIKASERTVDECYSRVVGYLRPMSQWNRGKQSELRDRVDFKVKATQVTDHENCRQPGS